MIDRIPGTTPSFKRASNDEPIGMGTKFGDRLHVDSTANEHGRGTGCRFHASYLIHFGWLSGA